MTIMHAISYNLGEPAAQDTSAPLDQSALVQHWNTVREAALLIAEFGAIPDEHLREVIADTPDFCALVARPHYNAVCYAIGDIAAALQPGLRALSGAAEAGGDTTIPARILWVELARAHADIIRLCERHL